MAYQNEMQNVYDTIDDLNDDTKYDDTLNESTTHQNQEQLTGSPQYLDLITKEEYDMAKHQIKDETSQHQHVPASGQIIHTHEEQPAVIHQDEHLRGPPKPLQIMESERAPPPKSCCRLPPCWGWLLIIIGISLLCVMVALLVVLLPRFKDPSTAG